MKLGLRRAFWTRDGGIDRSLIACEFCMAPCLCSSLENVVGYGAEL